MDDVAKAKARETRQRNTEARTALYCEQQAAIAAARRGFQRVLESPDASPAELLEAARLLAEIRCTREKAAEEMEQLGISPIKVSALPGFEWVLGETK